MRPARSSDGALGQIRSDQTVKALWADVAAASSREVYRYNHLEQEISHVVKIRYDADVLQGMYFKYDNRDLYILSVEDPTERKEWMKVICREGGNT